jgi:predicted GNAT family N-acyltransferase
VAEPDSPWEIVPLSSTHDIACFCCGRNPLDVYIRKWALVNQQEDMGRTFVLVRLGHSRVYGYYTISTSRIARASLPPAEQFSANYPVPAILIGKLAVDSGEQGKGLGQFLLMDALKRCQIISQQIAVRGVEVDALDERAESFYLQYGFRKLTDRPLHLYLSMGVIRNLGL